MRFPLPFRLLTPTGWVVAVVALLAVAGWTKAWYWPTVQTVTRTITETVTVPEVREVVKWKTRVETREIKVKEVPAKAREEAKAREGEDLLTAVAIPSAPRGGTAQAWLSREGETRIAWRENPRPFLELGGVREVSVWIGANDRYAVQYRQDLGRIGPAVVMAEASAESRRGAVGWTAGVGVGVRF